MASEHSPSRASTPPPSLQTAGGFGFGPNSPSSASDGKLRLLKPFPPSVAGSVQDMPIGDDELEDPGCCHPARDVYRLHLLVLLASLSFASYFCYDIPSAAEDLIKRQLDINTTSFGLLYSSYCFPNIFMGFFFGLLVDKYVGVRKGVVISSSLTLVGHILIVLGGYYRLFWLMCLGRFLFGIGGEALAVMQNVFIVAWFRGKELKLVFAVTQTFSRIGSVLNLNLTSLFADKFGLVAALLLGTVICVISVINSIAIAYLDRRAELVIDKQMAEVGDEFILKHLKKMPRSYWVLIVVCVLFYAVFFPFIGFGTEFFRYKYPRLSPGVLISMPYMISLVFAPVFGLIIDKLKYRVVWVCAGLVISSSAFVMMSVTLLNPYIPMTMLGFAYSIVVCTLWPMVAMLIPARQLGTAYGFLQALQNVFLTLLPPVYGYLFDHIGYMWMLIGFSVVITMAFIGAELLMFFNFIDGEGLNGPTPDEKAQAERATRKASRKKKLSLGTSGLLKPTSSSAGPSSPLLTSPTTHHNQSYATMSGSGVASFSIIPPIDADGDGDGDGPSFSVNAAPYAINTVSPLTVPGPSPLDLRKRYMTRLGIGGASESYKAMAMASGSTLK